MIFLVIIMTMSLSVSAQISTCSWHDGYWGQWKSHTTRYTYIPPSYEYDIYGNYSGFIIYKKGAHPSEYIFKFQANSYSTPDKKTIKYHMKNNLWYEYSGTVEYYVTENYPTIAGYNITSWFLQEGCRYDVTYAWCYSFLSYSACIPCIGKDTPVLQWKLHRIMYIMYWWL